MSGFFGEKNARIFATHEQYAGIETPQDLYQALLRIWCKDTCAPRMQKDWTQDNPTLGQCSITAFLAQDIFGGDVRGIPLQDGGVHCYNQVGDCVFDLTSEQFGDQVLNYENNPLQSRDQHFQKEEKYQRYLLLKHALQAQHPKRLLEDMKS